MNAPLNALQKEALQEKLKRQLFASPSLKAYAVLDGASNPALLDHLYATERPEFVCLFRGDLEPDMAECAPYLVKLERGSAFTEWVTGQCWGNHWGIFAVATADLRDMRQHLRKFNMVYDPEAKEPLYFRYYDPRVIVDFLGISDPEQSVAFFGPVRAFFGETDAGAILTRYELHGEKVQADPI